MHLRLMICGAAVLLLITAGAGAGSPPGPLSDEPRGALDLRQALDLVLQHNPDLAVSNWAIRAGEAHTRQARLLPNPELSTETENFAGNGELHGFSGAENTYAVGQLIELGGKRKQRVRLADTERSLAEWDYRSRRVETIAEVTRTFIAVLAGQRRLAVRREIVRLSEDFANIAGERVRAGKVSPIEEIRADVAAAKAKSALVQAEEALEAERRRLAALWGSPRPLFTKAVGELQEVTPIPTLDALSELLPGSPHLARWETEQERRAALSDMAAANRIPDLTLSGGLRYFRGTGERAYVAALQIPLPLFDRNQGAILEARLLKEMAGEEQRAARIALERELAAAYRDLNSAREAALALQERILPGAQTAFAAVNEGYRYGKFSYLDVLDTQRELFEVREEEVEALAAFHRAGAEVGRIIGQDLSALDRPSAASLETPVAE